MGCYVGFKYAKNALAAGASPRTPLGELTTLPKPLVGWGGDVPLETPPHSAHGLDSRFPALGSAPYT